MYEDNLDYARGRLEGTVVMLFGEPIEVKEIDYDGAVRVRRLKDPDEYFYCNLSDLDLVGQNKLGYVNYGPGAYYLMRKPLRNDWRQGLRMSNVCFQGEEGFGRFPFNELRDTILGNYPSFVEASGRINSGPCYRVAFSRCFALGDGNKIYYKQRLVGSYDKIVTLFEHFKYLTEHLEEILEVNYEKN